VESDARNEQMLRAALRGESAPVEVEASLTSSSSGGGDYMDVFYSDVTEDDASTQARDVRALL